MKIQLVYDLASNSTKDVAQGLLGGLRSYGHEVWCSPLHIYTRHLFAGVVKDGEDVGPQHWQTIHAAVNKVVMGDAMLFEPEAVLVVSGWTVATVAVQKIKALLGAKMALYMTESPYMDERQLRLIDGAGYDVIFCNELASVPLFAEHHPNVHYLPHSYDPAIHRPTAGEVRGCDVYFCATGFPERCETLAAVDWSGIDLRLTGLWPHAAQYGLESYLRGEIVPNEMLPAIYANVPINLNIHRTTKDWSAEEGGGGSDERIEYAESIGPRVYEVLACGGFLITDHRAEMDGFLRDGEHLAIYRDAEHLGHLVRHYLQHGDERKRIANAGRLAVRDCTFGRRSSNYILPNLCKEGVTING